MRTHDEVVKELLDTATDPHGWLSDLQEYKPYQDYDQGIVMLIDGSIDVGQMVEIALGVAE